MEYDTFQRDTLQRLQEAGKRLLISTHSVFYEKWPTSQVYEPDSIAPDKHPISLWTDAERKKARYEVDMLISRVDNDNLRGLVRDVSDRSRHVLGVEQYHDAEQALRDLEERFSVASDVLGSILQKLLKKDKAQQGA